MATVRIEKTDEADIARERAEVLRQFGYDVTIVRDADVARCSLVRVDGEIEPVDDDLVFIGAPYVLVATRA